MTDRLQRKITFEPGWDRRSEGQGIHGMGIRFVLTGPKGSISWLLNTGWLPGRGRNTEVGYPVGAHVGFHGEKPFDGDRASYSDTCAFNESGRCWYDAGFLMADDVLELLLTSGEEAAWGYLAERYEELDS